MKRMLIAAVTGLAIAMPLLGTATPAASGVERQKMMQEHMKMMQDMGKK